MVLFERFGVEEVRRSKVEQRKAYGGDPVGGGLERRGTRRHNNRKRRRIDSGGRSWTSKKRHGELLPRHPTRNTARLHGDHL